MKGYNVSIDRAFRLFAALLLAAALAVTGSLPQLSSFAEDGAPAEESGVGGTPGGEGDGSGEEDGADESGGEGGESGVFGATGEYQVSSTGTLGGVYCAGNVLTIENTDDRITVSNTNGPERLIEGNILVSALIGDVDLVLDGVGVKSYAPGSGALHVSAGEVNVTLRGENTLIGRNGNAGLQTGDDSVLVIRGEEGGSLDARAEAYGAGIGAGSEEDAGDLIIESGEVTARGGLRGAGIGAGFSAYAGDITIRGGEVTAIGSEAGAGIGGGFRGAAGNITITGGRVTACAEGPYGAGIGGGYMRSGTGDITLAGGSVTAVSARSGGAAIGGGMQRSPSGAIVVSGGEVAASGYEGAGIGGGLESSPSGDIAVSGGEVAASSRDTAGIGGGRRDSPSGRIALTGGTLRASGAPSDASVGNVSGADAPPVMIGGGSVNADVVRPAPVNGEGRTVYKNTISFAADAADVRLVRGWIDETPCAAGEPRDGAYGIKDVMADERGSLYLWLPVRRGAAAGVSFFIGDDYYNANYERAGRGAALLKRTAFVDAPGPFDAVYGETLGGIRLPQGWSFIEAPVTGVGPAGARRHPAVYEPKEAGLEPAVKSVLLNVARRDPSPALVGVLSAVYGQTLGEIALPDGWKWNEGRSAPVGEAGAREHGATYTHPDASNHNTVGAAVELAVEKAAPDTGGALEPVLTTDDRKLGEVALPEGWSWDEGPGAPAGPPGAGERAVTFTPKDTTNYLCVRGSVLLIVNDAQPAAAAAPDGNLADESGAPDESVQEEAGKVELRFYAASGYYKTRKVSPGGRIGKLPKATRDGYRFTGWYTKRKGGVRVTSAHRVTDASPRVFYARWKKVSLYGEVTSCALLTLRKHPSSVAGVPAASVGYLKRSQKLRVLGEPKAGWYRVEAGKRSGYVSKRYVRLVGRS
jgi:uncharacterized repeat protein (TIGR02543 family)